MPTETHPGMYGLTKYWDVATLRWVKGTQPGSSAGGGDASAANQVIGNASLSSIDGKTPALGQALAASSTPVVLTAIQFAALTPPAAITGYALETGGNLASIKTNTDKIPALGQALAASSVPVVLTAIQIATLTPPAAITGFNLEATQLLVKAKTDNLDVLLSSRLKPADTLTGVTTVTTVTTVAAVTAITNALPVGANVIGKVSIDQTTPGTTNKVDVGTMANVVVAMNTGVRAAGVQRVTVCTDDLVPVSAPVLTKGTQGANGFSTQDLKDAGRNQLNFYMVIQIVTTATDALLALTGYKSGALVAATTTPAVVTAGKTYRINSVTMEYTSIVTTEGSVRFTLRANLSGTVVIGSPVVCVWEVGQTGSGVSVAGKKNTITIPFPDGIEFAAGTGIGISQVGLSPVGAAAIAGYGRISINGYEY